MELLGISNSPENAERRQGAISALRELLKQGLEVEASCQVQDWPCFLSQALKKLMATEIIDLLPWGDLAITRKNKKSLESQNQRVVIDLNCFYMACIAHIAVGFSSHQIELVIINASSTRPLILTFSSLSLTLSSHTHTHARVRAHMAPSLRNET